MTLVLYNPVSCDRPKAPLPMSLMALASVLEGQHDYELLDGNFLDDHDTEVPEFLDKVNASAVGMTIMPGPQLNHAVPLQSKLRKSHPDLAESPEVDGQARP